MTIDRNFSSKEFGLLLFLSLLVCVIDITKVGWFVAIYILVSLSFFFRRDLIFCLILFAIPNQRILSFSDGGFSIITILVIIYIALSFFYRPRNVLKISLSPLVIASFVFVIYSFSYVLVLGKGFDFLNSIKFMLGVVFVSLVSYDNKDTHKLIYQASIFFSFGLILSVINPIVDGGTAIFSSRLAASNASPNNLATLSIFSLILLYYILKVDLKFGRWHSYFISGLIVLVVFIGFLSQSRSFFLSLFLFFIFVCLSSVSKSSVKGLFYIALFSIFTTVIAYHLLPEAFESVTNRILSPRGGDISGSRFGLWFDYMNLSFRDVLGFLFGYGSEDLLSRLGFTQVAHNYLIEALVAYGIIGVLLLLSVYGLMIYTIAGKSFGLVFFPPFVIVNVSHFTGHGLLSFEFLLKVFLICLLYRSLREANLNV